MGFRQKWSPSAAAKPFLNFFSLFELKIEVVDNTVMSELQTGLLSYLRSSPYQQEQKTFEIKQLERELASLDAEIERMTSFQISIAEHMETNPNVPLSVEASMSTLSDLQTARHNLQKKLAFIDDVHFLNSFTAFSKPSGPRLLKYALNGALVGLLAAIAAIFLLELNLVIRAEEARGKA